MLEFKPVTKQEAPRLRRYYQTCEFGLCEYSVGTKLMWKAALHPAWAAGWRSGASSTWRNGILKTGRR